MAGGNYRYDMHLAFLSLLAENEVYVKVETGQVKIERVMLGKHDEDDPRFYIKDGRHSSNLSSADNDVDLNVRLSFTASAVRGIDTRGRFPTIYVAV